MYGATTRAIREMKNLVDTLFEYREDEQTRDDLKGELDRFMEVDKRNWSRELRDLANSIIELVIDEVD